MLPAGFPAALFVVQHIGPNRSILPALLSRAGPLPASHPAHGQEIVPGHIYVAPDHHMRLTPGLIHLNTGPKIHFTRPAADPLFQSAALAYGARVVGVTATEMPFCRKLNALGTEIVYDSGDYPRLLDKALRLTRPSACPAQ